VTSRGHLTSGTCDHAQIVWTRKYPRSRRFRPTQEKTSFRSLLSRHSLLLYFYSNPGRQYPSILQTQHVLNPTTARLSVILEINRPIPALFPFEPPYRRPDGRRKRPSALRAPSAPLLAAHAEEVHRDLLDHFRYRHSGSAPDPVLDAMVPHRSIAQLEYVRSVGV
jgi:hypothetical protein